MGALNKYFRFMMMDCTKYLLLFLSNLCYILYVFFVIVLLFCVSGEWTGFMLLLEERIRKDGKILEGNVLKVDSFLNHQMDVELFREMGKELARLYKDCGVNKILTIEASGIGIACVAALEFGCPAVFAKKYKTSNIADEVYSATVFSYTHGREYQIVVNKNYINENDRILLIDDFLANGEALAGLITLVRQSGATVVGAGIAIEKAFQPGGDKIRSMGVRVESLARIQSMSVTDGVVFC